MVEAVQEIVPALEDLCDESASHNGSAEFGLSLPPGSIRQRGCHTCVEEWNPRGVARVKNPGIGFMRKSRAGRVELAADPPTPDGMLEGAVRSVSADVLRLENEAKFLNGGEDEREISMINVLANVQDQKRNRNRRVSLVAAGMQVRMAIRQEQRTVMGYVWLPVKNVASEAGEGR